MLCIVTILHTSNSSKCIQDTGINGNPCTYVQFIHKCMKFMSVRIVQVTHARSEHKTKIGDMHDTNKNSNNNFLPFALFTHTCGMQPHPQQHRSTQLVPLVITYHPALSRTSRTLKKHLNILHISNRLKAAIPDPPVVAFRGPHNLRDLLIKLKRTNTNRQWPL